MDGSDPDLLADAPELLSAAEMQAVDARAIAGGADGFALMRRAGQAVARHVARMSRRGARVLVAAGPGNNGGDGAVAARALAALGREVTLLRFGASAREGSDAARAFAGWDGPTVVVDPSAGAPNDAALALVDGAEIVVDALLGAGLSRDVDGALADLVRAIERSAARVVAVDLPSGLDGDAHRVRGVAARADLTVTFVRYKIAHCLEPGRALCGELRLADIGMPRDALAAVLDAAETRCFVNVPTLWRSALRAPAREDHKYRRGQVLVRGGPIQQTGAARLAAGAALHAGAGLVILATRADALAVNAAQLTAVMLRRCDGGDDWRTLLDDERTTAVVVGPGNGVDAATRDAVEALLATDRSAVLDADALGCHGGRGDEGELGGGDRVARFLDALRARSAQTVLTPHEGEFARLFGRTDVTELPSKLHRARAAAALAGSTVVLKGADTVVAAPDGRAAIALNAPPWLATAGAGDVLAGAIAALLAQGAPAFESACAAVWLHGEAARALGWPLTAEALGPELGAALGRLLAPFPPPLPGALEPPAPGGADDLAGT